MDLRENFARDLSLDKEIVKLWKSSRSRDFKRNFYHCGIGEIWHILLITPEVVNRFFW